MNIKLQKYTDKVETVFEAKMDLDPQIEIIEHDGLFYIYEYNDGTDAIFMQARVAKI